MSEMSKFERSGFALWDLSSFGLTNSHLLKLSHYGVTHRSEKYTVKYMYKDIFCSKAISV